jgi:hypothetical protein
MSDEKPGKSNTFVDLASFESVKPVPKGNQGNMIKGSCVVARGIQKIEVSEGEGEQPTVVVHRVGDVVESIEFVCKCGQTTIIKLDYGGE